MFAQWLDTFCHPFDYAVLQAIHNFAMAMGGENGFFTWFMHFISLLGEKGIGLIVTGLVLLLFKKTRRAGICVLAALLCSSIITNIVLKNIISRVRPFNQTEVQAFIDWWHAIGANTASENSFPSGHTSAAVAAMSALFLSFPKKYSWTAFIFVILTGLSRMYLVVHYPSDILGGILAGALAATGGYFITYGLITLLKKKENTKVGGFILHSDLTHLFRPKKALAAAKSGEISETVQENVSTSAEAEDNAENGKK